MVARDVVVQFKADVSQFNARMKELLAQLGLVRDGMASLGQAGKVKDITQSAQQLTAQYKQTGKALDFIVRRMQALQKLQQTGGRLGGAATAGSKALGIPGFSPIGAGKDTVRDFLAQDTQRAKELTGLMEHMAGIEMGKWAEQLPPELQKSLGISQKYLNVQKNLEKLSQGDLRNQARLARLKEIAARREAGAEVEAGYKQGALGLLPSQSLAKIKKAEEAEVNKLRSAQRQLNKLHQQEASLIQQSNQALDKKDAVQAAILGKKLKEVQAEKGYQTRRKTEATSELAAVRQRRTALEGAAGVKQDLQELADDMGTLGKAQDEVFAGKGFKNWESTFTQIQNAATKNIQDRIVAQEKLDQLDQKRLSRPGPDPTRGGAPGLLNKKDQAAYNSALRETVRLEKEGVALLERGRQVVARSKGQDARGRDLPATQSITALEAQGKAQIGRLSRTMLGAFEGFGRRFEATLQFAISGALIFGVQKVLREFVQTAIEVERAFKDIETALEFDISAPRGTHVFEQQVESLRREILGVAQDYNVLPTEANKAAFVMVSRFGETENAVKALRSQLLATKVSGIDQTEVLRALTAVAEGFSSATIDVNDGLSLQEKLLRKEAASAELYAQALDLAVFIQQKFGIETEDVLEGTARATEVFKIMGFTMQETAALVSAVSRQLGQTGVQSAERLVRSIGQLTSNQTRNALLELAAASDTFQLSIADFGSGAQAWEAIANQFDRIQNAEPGVAAAILQIVGQRREAEAVAAALGTIPLQQSIVASSGQAIGAAERRWKFLETTIAEQIESIKVGFQELAQNIEQLGLLTPLRLMLSTLEGIITATNTVIKLVNTLINSLNKVPILGDLGLGELVKWLGSVTIALASTRLVLRSALQVAPILASGRARAAAAAGITRTAATRLPETVAMRQAGKVFLASTIAANTSFKQVRDNLQKFGRSLVLFGIRATEFSLMRLRESRLGQVVGGKVGRQQTRLLTIPAYAKASNAVKAFTAKTIGLAGKFAGLIGAAGVLTGVFFALRSAGEASAQGMKEFRESVRVGQTTARFEAVEQELTPSQEAARAYEVTLEDLNRKFADGQGVISNMSTAWNNLAQGLLGQDVAGFLFGTQFENDPSREGRLGGQLGIGRAWDKDDRKLIQSSEEWWRWQLDNARKDFFTAQQKVLAERFQALPGAVTREDQLGREALGSELGSALKALGEAETTEEIDDAVARIVQIDLSITAVEKAALRELESLEVTLKLLQTELARIDRDLSLGRTTHGEAAGNQRRISGLLQQAGQEYFEKAITPDDFAEAEAFFAAADQAMLSAFENEKAVLDRTAQKGQLVEGQANKLRASVKAAEAEILHAIETAGYGTDAWFDAWIKFMNAAQDEIAHAAGRKIASLNAQVGFAQTTEKYLFFLDQLIAEIKRQIGEADSNEEANALREQLQAATIARNDRVKDELQRLAIANAKLEGPIRNQQNALRGEIEAIQLDLDSGIEGADLAEARVAMAEALISVAELEADRIAANALLQVGVADKVGKLTADLARANEAMAIAAGAYGVNSTEWANAALAVDNLKYQIHLSEIELEILTQRLDTDITNPYIQASLNLAEILAKLNNPDLGELDRAQLEGEKQRAEAEVRATEISGKLFNLKYLYETDQLGLSGYLAALEGLLLTIDTATYAGKQAFLEISNLIDSLTDQASDMAFNVPTSIRLPTIFEVRRALAADQLGVNYQDNRQQDIYVNVRDAVDLGTLLSTLDRYASGQINIRSNAYAPGGAGITMGSV